MGDMGELSCSLPILPIFQPRLCTMSGQILSYCGLPNKHWGSNFWPTVVLLRSGLQHIWLLLLTEHALDPDRIVSRCSNHHVLILHFIFHYQTAQQLYKIWNKLSGVTSGFPIIQVSHNSPFYSLNETAIICLSAHPTKCFFHCHCVFLSRHFPLLMHDTILYAN